MSNVIRLDGRSGGESPPSTSISALRMISALDPDEFADAVAQELGWPVPLLVYLEWERGEDSVPPPQVLHAAHEVARQHPIGSMTKVSRRRFLEESSGSPRSRLRAVRSARSQAWKRLERCQQAPGR